jgi:DNA-binding IclR family transcriptional regulator
MRLALRLHMEIGSRRSAYSVSGGKVLLAHLDAKLCRRLLRSRKLRPATSHTLVHVAELEAELEKIRELGFALNDQEYMDGIVGAAVPVIDPKGNVLAAVGMQGPLPRLTVEACEKSVPRMRHAAKRIARVWFD